MTKEGMLTQAEAFYDLVERCSEPPYLEMFARAHREGWDQWGNQVEPTPESSRKPIRQDEGGNVE